MNIYCTTSRGGNAAKYISALLRLGHRVLDRGTDALLSADALFLCITGADNRDVKADLNLVLDRGIPVAYALEEGAEPDQGLILQLGLARRISPQDPEGDLEGWLRGVKKRKKPLAPKARAAICAAALLLIVGGMLLWKNAVSRAVPASAAVTEAPAETPLAEGAEYFGGAAPETLKTLDLSGLGLTDIAFLERAVNLEELDLSGNAIEDISPLGSLTKLKTLDLSRNKITDANVLLALDRLEWVDLTDNPIEDRTALDFLEGVEVVG